MTDEQKAYEAEKAARRARLDARLHDLEKMAMCGDRGAVLALVDLCRSYRVLLSRCYDACYMAREPVAPEQDERECIAVGLEEGEEP